MAQPLGRIEISNKDSQSHPEALDILNSAHQWGLKSLTNVSISTIYIFQGHHHQNQLKRIAKELLLDPLTQDWQITNSQPTSQSPNQLRLSVSYRPGVFEPILKSLMAGLEDLKLHHIKPLGTAKHYCFEGQESLNDLHLFASKFLYNPLAQWIGEPGQRKAHNDQAPAEHDVPLAGLSPEALLKLSQNMGLALNTTEMQAIQSRFATLGRAPRLIELETLAQTWSEHCVHKTLKAQVQHGDTTFENLLVDTIVAATEAIDAPYCVSVFKDNAGIVHFDEHWDLCFKAETHNHPSAIEPYGGSATGLGGVIRDILGAGMGARPILGLDVFCFGPQNLTHQQLPEGCLHPARIQKGVVAGLRDYGNRVGLPTAVGAVYYGHGYIANPVVLAGALGVMPRNMHDKSVQAGDYVVLLGGRTGRDGIHGVTFSSESLSSDSEELDRSAVQIGDPIVEQIIIEPLLRARDAGLYRNVTDCGGGGLSSAIGEMGEGCGVEVELAKVPLKEQGLSPSEIWISESQERMILAVPPEHWPTLKALFDSEDVPCTRIGHFTGDQKLTLKYNQQTVGDLAMSFLHDGIPKRSLKSTPPNPRRELGTEKNIDLEPEQALLAILRQPNVCSKESIIRQYDHEVQGRTVQGPFAGIAQGPQDGVVLLPNLNSNRAAVVAVGFQPLYSALDVYRMAANSIDEAVRNCVSAGGDPETLSLLDNFIWGDVSDPDELGGLVEAAVACKDMAEAFQAPFISGKDSLNNTYIDSQGQKRSITPTLIISALATVPDARKSVPSAFQSSGSKLYLLGQTKIEMGGSHYYHLSEAHKSLGVVPEVQPKLHFQRAKALHKAMQRGLVLSCHDCAEGGLAVAMAEMALSSQLGCQVDLSHVAPSLTASLFSESSGRYLVEVPAAQSADFEALCGPHLCQFLGQVTESQELQWRYQGNQQQVSVKACQDAWRTGL